MNDNVQILACAFEPGIGHLHAFGGRERHAFAGTAGHKNRGNSMAPNPIGVPWDDVQIQIAGGIHRSQRSGDEIEGLVHMGFLGGSLIRRALCYNML